MPPPEFWMKFDTQGHDCGIKGIQYPSSAFFSGLAVYLDQEALNTCSFSLGFYMTY